MGGECVDLGLLYLAQLYELWHQHRVVDALRLPIAVLIDAGGVDLRRGPNMISASSSATRPYLGPGSFSSFLYSKPTGRSCSNRFAVSSSMSRILCLYLRLDEPEMLEALTGFKFPVLSVTFRPESPQARTYPVEASAQMP